MTAERLTLTVEEASQLLGISRALGYDMARTGRLPALRFGKRFVIPRKALDNLLAQADSPNPQEQNS